jgi:hypothetical protein
MLVMVVIVNAQKKIMKIGKLQKHKGTSSLMTSDANSMVKHRSGAIK